MDRSEVGFAARITLGSVLRQTARHPEAEVIDSEALALASDPLQRTDAAISLVADAVGRLDPAAASERLRAAERAIVGDDERGFIRLDWVRAEVELLGGHPAVAVVHARSAQVAARALGWPRHLAKSALFAGASCAAAGDAGDAALGAAAERHLREAFAVAGEIGAVPIADAARALLDDR